MKFEEAVRYGFASDWSWDVDYFCNYVASWIEEESQYTAMNPRYEIAELFSDCRNLADCAGYACKLENIQVGWLINLIE